MGSDDPGRPWAEAPASFLLEILDLVAHPVFVKDRAFRFVFLNRALCTMVGYSRESMLGKTDYDFFPREEADFFRAKDVEMFESGSEVVIDEEPITDSRGTRHVLATTKVPLRDAEGGITHLVGIIHDITRLKDAEDALRQANADLERRVEERSAALAAVREDLHRKERLAVLGRLAGGVAHEIRNPLAAIRGAAQILARHGPAGDVPAVVSIIQEEVGRADRIIGDLIDYARARPPARRPVAVGYVVAQALGGQIWKPWVVTGRCASRLGSMAPRSPCESRIPALASRRRLARSSSNRWSRRNLTGSASGWSPPRRSSRTRVACSRTLTETASEQRSRCCCRRNDPSVTSSGSRHDESADQGFAAL